MSDEVTLQSRGSVSIDLSVNGTPTLDFAVAVNSPIVDMQLLLGGARGPQGEQGLQGPPGNDGAAGPEGPAGPSILTVAVKSADETRFDGSSAKADDAEMTITLDANSVYRLDMIAYLSMQGKGFALNYALSSAPVFAKTQTYSSSGAPLNLTGASALNNGTTVTDAADVRWAIVVTDAVPITVTLQWNSGTVGLLSNGTILRAGSYLIATKLG